MFYVYEWYVIETGEIVYVGKGTGRRYKVKKRGKKFSEFLESVPCESRIVKFFEDESDAFDYEEQRITYLKKSGQCRYNLNSGGFGGQKAVWSAEKREMMSKFNPMKQSEQRDRMSKNNPMKNPDIAKKMAIKRGRPIVFNGVQYHSQVEAANKNRLCTHTILSALKRGCDTSGNPCYYLDEGPRNVEYNRYPFKKKVIIDGKLYDSVNEAAKSIDVWPETLIRCIKKNKKCKGLECRYDNQQLSQGNPN